MNKLNMQALEAAARNSDPIYLGRGTKIRVRDTLNWTYWPISTGADAQFVIYIIHVMDDCGIRVGQLEIGADGNIIGRHNLPLLNIELLISEAGLIN